LIHAVAYYPKVLSPKTAPKALDWKATGLYEIKFDGYRALAFKDGKEVRLVSRNNKPLNYHNCLVLSSFWLSSRLCSMARSSRSMRKAALLFSSFKFTKAPSNLLDRLSRSLKDLLHILEKITEAGGGFRSITEHVDTTTPAGRMMLQMLGAFAEFERSMVRERTRMGLQAARERGRVGGRKPKLKPNQRAEIIEMVNSGTKSAAEAARLFGLHRSTISRLLAVERLSDK